MKFLKPMRVASSIRFGLHLICSFSEINSGLKIVSTAVFATSYMYSAQLELGFSFMTSHIASWTLCLDGNKEFVPGWTDLMKSSFASGDFRG